MTLLPLDNNSITVSRHIGNGICWPEVPHLLNRISAPVAPCDLAGLHIAGCVEIRVDLDVHLFFAAAVQIHHAALLQQLFSAYVLNKTTFYFIIAV